MPSQYTAHIIEPEDITAMCMSSPDEATTHAENSIDKVCRNIGDDQLERVDVERVCDVVTVCEPKYIQRDN